MANSKKTIKVGEVFKPGGQPTYSYVNRDNERLERKLRDGIDSPYKIISVTGPSKCGKTVLVRRVLPRDPSSAIWISGGSIADESEFWSSILEKLRIPMQTATTADTLTRTDATRKFDISGKPLNVGVGAESNYTRTTQERAQQTETFVGVPANAALDALKDRKTPLVVDDFHYIPAESRVRIVRTLKDLIFDEVPVVLLSVPHRRYDVIRAENEMTGRFSKISVPSWQDHELIQLAELGFEALSVSLKDIDAFQMLVDESLRSPLLMQEFCYRLCCHKVNNIRKQARTPTSLVAPPNWAEFFGDCAEDMGQSDFDDLAAGPIDGDNSVMRFANGGSGTIYEAVLISMSKLEPSSVLSFEDIRREASDVIVEGTPSTDALISAIQKLSEIASARCTSVPVLEWDEAYRVVYFANPFFPYYLRWSNCGKRQ